MIVSKPNTGCIHCSKKWETLEYKGDGTSWYWNDHYSNTRKRIHHYVQGYLLTLAATATLRRCLTRFCARNMDKNIFLEKDNRGRRNGFKKIHHCGCWNSVKVPQTVLWINWVCKNFLVGEKSIIQTNPRTVHWYCEHELHLWARTVSHLVLCADSHMNHSGQFLFTPIPHRYLDRPCLELGKCSACLWPIQDRISRDVQNLPA